MRIYERNLSNLEQAQRAYDAQEPDWAEDSCENNGHDWELVGGDHDLEIMTFECTVCGARKTE